MSDSDRLPLHTISENLQTWFWEHGIRRNGAYEIPLSDWVAPLYRLQRSSLAVESSLAQLKPAMAIWGPSQTGKSTSVSAYMDAGANGELVSADEDGKGTGLHWPGAPGFFFMAPLVEDINTLPTYLTRKVLNPYNKGMDGSSCLTRFTAGSLEPSEGMHRVTFPTHPVTLSLVSPQDLLHALACGYASECLGPKGREPRRWSLDQFRETVKSVQRRLGPTKNAPSETAFDRLFELTEVLGDLADTPGGPWSSLNEDPESFSACLRAMQTNPAFLAGPDRVDELATALLWEGLAPLTGIYQKMRSFWERHCGKNGRWYGRPLCLSMEAAALFLNMGACEIRYRSRQPEQSPEGILQGLMDQLGWSEREGVILIDCSGGGESLGRDAEAFSILQGLVWELLVPVNWENLPDRLKGTADREGKPRPNVLKRFLKEADILDFPGVGNETKSLDSRILLDPGVIEEVRRRASSADASSADKARASRTFSEQLFFREILKRGKTASIVATYSKRLNMDAFCIFQGLRGYACPNADQLIHGVKSWWRQAVPEFAANPTGPSPLPLYLVLTWWATQLNKATPNDSNIYEKVIGGIVGNLGLVQDPETATTFAIHYHNSPDRDFAVLKNDFTPGSSFHRSLIAESAFSRQFRRDVSRQSFDEMVTDLDTGGAEFFFREALNGIRAAREQPETHRGNLLAKRREGLVKELKVLLGHRGLRPVARPKDERRERLEHFRDGLRKRLDTASRTEKITISHTLRELLDFRYEGLDVIPSTVTLEYLEAQLNRWVQQQVIRFDEVSGDTALMPQWKVLGLESREDMQVILDSLTLSVRRDLVGIQKWLQNIADAKHGLSLRRLLAVRLQNLFTYPEDGPPPGPFEDDLDETYSVPEDYVFFLTPWIKPGGTLDRLIAREVQPRKRPDLPGDAEIEKLARTVGLPPAES